MEKSGAFAQRLMSVLFPERCFGCRRISESIWCAGCRGELHPVEDAVCARCGEPLETEICDRCRRWPPPYDSLQCGFLYDDALRGVILSFKYGGYRRLAAPLGELLRPLLTAAIDAGAEIIIPMPADPLRRWRRGFNPAELIARAAAEPLGVTMTSEALRRRPGARPQVGLEPEKRRTNLIGQFHVPRPELVAGRNAVLIDDVITTGSTCGEAARTLKAAGAAAVHALALAHD